MARITIYVPDDLKSQMDAAGDDLNWSAITQRAFREAIATQNLKRNPTDMNNVIERLRASKQRVEEGSLASGRECGVTWAKTEAEYDELKRVADLSSANQDMSLNGLQRTIDPEDTLAREDWEGFWTRNGDGSPNDAFAEGFCMGAQEVFDEVKDKL